MWTRGEHPKLCNQSSGSNQRPWRCEVAKLPAASLYHLENVCPVVGNFVYESYKWFGSLKSFD